MNSTRGRVALAFACMLGLVSSASTQTSYSLKSPDGRIEIRVRATERIRYDLVLKDKVLLQDSDLSINIDHNPLGVNPKVVAHKERKYLPQAMNQIAPTAIASLPALVDVDGVKVAIAESDVEDYPGLWLRGTSGNGLAAIFEPYPLKERLERDRDYKVVESADYIAVAKGTRTFPWRLVGIAERDADLVTNPLVWLLEKPSQVQDPSWIKPGKVAWDWWNANNVYGVNFKAGVNTQTYKHYIDFAAKYGIPYIILDEGWYKLG